MKEKILFAAAAELNTRGIRFTVDSVAARLGISKKTIYRYYASKEELITRIIEEALADVAVRRNEAMAEPGNFVAKLTALITSEPKIFGRINYWVLDDIKRYLPAEWERITCFRQKLARDVARILEEGIQSGDIRPVNTAVAAQLLLRACDDYLDYRFLEANNLTFGDALQALNDIFQYGVLAGTPKSEAGGRGKAGEEI